MRYVDEGAFGLLVVLRRRVFVERLRGYVECGSLSKMWSCGCAPTGIRSAAAALSVSLCSLSVCCSSSDESRMLPVVVTSTSVSVTFGGG